jgi:hypothetical protein
VPVRLTERWPNLRISCESARPASDGPFCPPTAVGFLILGKPVQREFFYCAFVRVAKRAELSSTHAKTPSMHGSYTHRGRKIYAYASEFWLSRWFKAHSTYWHAGCRALDVGRSGRVWGLVDVRAQRRINGSEIAELTLECQLPGMPQRRDAVVRS